MGHANVLIQIGTQENPLVSKKKSDYVFLKIFGHMGLGFCGIHWRVCDFYLQNTENLIDKCVIKGNHQRKLTERLLGIFKELLCMQ